MIVHAQNISKSYSQAGRSIQVLKNLHFSLAKKESLAIVGQSGSGKSTLLSLLSGLEKPDQGSLFFDDIDLGTLSENQLTALRAQRISLIFQDYHLVPHLTAVENVQLSLDIKKMPEAEKQARHWLEKVGLQHRSQHFPAELSGGEQQRVAIARSLAIQPDLLLADEPSGSLDEQTGQHITQLMFDLLHQSSASLILVTHNQALAKLCGRTLHLKEGQLV